MSLIYILHFDECLAHARHYIGVTTQQNLYKRLRQHAMGYGAVLTRELLRLKINWRLGGLIVADGHPRIHEDHLKRQANAKRFCQCCTCSPRRLRGTLPMDINIIKWATDSISLRERPNIPTEGTV